MKRYWILLLCSVLLALLSCQGEPKPGGEEPGGTTAPSDYTVSGIVTGSDGQALADVVVSDGLHCTKTDASGRFYLASDLKTTDYVFVSTPKGYSAPVEEGSAVFWKFLKDCTQVNGRYEGIRFTLNKIAHPERFSIIIYADPQPRARGAGYDKLAYHSLDCCDDMYRDMKELVATMSDRPVYGLGLGDIVHRDLTLLPAYKKGMASTGIATYNVIGNHDHDVTSTTDRDAARVYESYLGPANYSFNIGNLHVVTLDNMIAPLDPDTGTVSDSCQDGLTDEIWQWLQNDLSYVPKTATIMVCSHSPMFRLFGGKDRSARHAADYRALLGSYAKVYAWAGHVHATLNYVDTASPVIETHTLTRVCGNLWTNEYLGANGTPRGYTVFEYDEGDISWKFKPIYYQTGVFSDSNGGNGEPPAYRYRDWDYVNGRAIMRATGEPLDDRYQMQVFAPGTYGDDYLYVNVFLWDELWDTPRFTHDGILQKMTRVTNTQFMYAYCNREIMEYYKANNSVLNGAAFNFSSSNTESMFRVFVTDPHGSGTVSVKDRFGNTHTANIKW